ncbi:MAG: hypothetical protein QM484_09135 [Woeseiaceae bacterium]
MSSSISRRKILSGLMKLLFFIGFIFLTIPFISTFTTNELSEKKNSSTHWIIETPVADLAAGELSTFHWSGGLVWVYARTSKEIEALKTQQYLLHDAMSMKSDQPDSMRTNLRSSDEKYFVFIPHENKRSCQVSLKQEPDQTLFSEPCFNSKYDVAGRRFKNSGHQAQQNLSVPKHIIENGILKVAVWLPKI